MAACLNGHPDPASHADARYRPSLTNAPFEVIARL
jgi:hypothetical protein